MPVSRQPKAIREMTWDSIPSQSNTPTSLMDSRSSSTSRTPGLTYSLPYPKFSSSSVGPQTPTTSPVRVNSPYKASGTKGNNLGASKRAAARELSFDSIRSGSDVIAANPVSNKSLLMSPFHLVTEAYTRAHQGISKDEASQAWRPVESDMPSRYITPMWSKAPLTSLRLPLYSSPPWSSSSLEHEELSDSNVEFVSLGSPHFEQICLDDPDVDVVGLDDPDVDVVGLDDPDVDVVGLDDPHVDVVGLDGTDVDAVGWDDCIVDIEESRSDDRHTDRRSLTSGLPLNGEGVSFQSQQVMITRGNKRSCYEARQVIDHQHPSDIVENMSYDSCLRAGGTLAGFFHSASHDNTGFRDPLSTGRTAHDGDVSIGQIDNEWIQSPNIDFSSRVEPLQNCISMWAMGYEWDVEAEQNPLWDLQNQPLMGQQVMDSVVSYLAYHVVQKEPLHRRTCIIPPSLFGNIKQLEGVTRGLDAWLENAGPDGRLQLAHSRAMVWTDPQTPTRVLMPIIDHEAAHCYLWYGDLKPDAGPSHYSCELKYLDSLSRPSDRVFENRFQEAKHILQFLLPQINGEITSSYQSIPGYQQRSGSTDCGFFVCQAVSALAFGHDQMLWSLIPVHLVRGTVFRILEACRDRALVKLTQGWVSRAPLILHNPPGVAPPPWLPTAPRSPETPPPQVRIGRHSKTMPIYERSLSEPIGECMLQTSRGGWEDVLGSAAGDTFASLSSDSFKGYVERIREGRYDAPRGVLADAGAQLPHELLSAVLLDDAQNKVAVEWLDGSSIPEANELGGLEFPEDGLGIGRFTTALAHLQDGRDRSLAILTGTNKGVPLRLNWDKDLIDLEEDWLTANLDIDSLSLTATDPDFIMPVTLHAYPPRASTLTTDNGLRTVVNGETRPLSHFPNYPLLNAGNNNQFRINLFFPQYDKGKNNGGRFITMLASEDYALVYDRGIIPAVRRAVRLAPEHLKDAAIRLEQTLPKSYDLAEDRALRSGVRSFTGYKVAPELINLVLRQLRRIVDNKLELAKFRSYFYHMWAIDLKSVGQMETRKHNTLLHMLRSYPLVDWSLQNPRDIVVDVGIEINVREDKLPLDIKNLTLIWKLDALRRLVNSSWRKPTIDAYVHSHVVGGISCKPRSRVAKMMYYFHAYQKDKTLTYIHRDNSIGCSFSPEDGILGDKAYVSETKSLARAWSNGVGSYGVRAEWRCSTWAASKILTMDPDLWLRRFVSNRAISGYHTSQVVLLKRAMLSSYKWFFANIQQLPTISRTTEEVRLLAAVLAYLIHGLVQRPDDMSSSRAMAKDLDIVSRAIRFGFASVSPDRLAPDLVRMNGDINLEEYPILKYISRKNPAGARLKASHKHLPPIVDETEIDPGNAWTRQDDEWVEQLLNITLAGWIWGRMPDQDRRISPGRSAHTGPFLLSRWPHAVDQGVQYGVRTSSRNFQAVLDRFLPPNWRLIEAETCWRALDPVFLEPIRNRIEGVERSQRANISAQIRLAAIRSMRNWEYLPCSRKREVWSYEGSGRTRKYMVYRNPNFISRRN